ncbi:MAG: 3-phosphoshikimate 1-carboxyvinyltransferase [Pseudomonadota bacterium]
MSRRLRVRPLSRPLKGDYVPPGDKSISHRVAILGGLADGVTTVRGFLEAADTRATLNAMAQLGAEVSEQEGVITIRGGQIKAPGAPLDLGNSGTGIRLMAGMLSGRREMAGADISLVGDESLSSRPMGRIIKPLSEMGAVIASNDEKAPLTIRPRALQGIRYAMPVASAQVKSSVLLAGLAAEGQTVVVEPGPSRDHTERLLPAFGVDILDGNPGVGVAGGAQLQGTAVRVPGDLSSAAFILAAALVVPGSEVVLDNVGLNPSRDGVLRIMEAMGAEIDVEAGDAVGAEPVGRLRVRSRSLQGQEIPAAWVPLAIDEFPIIMALAACADGTTVVRGARELRVKESDRIAVMCAALQALGVDVTEVPDGATVQGSRIRGGLVDSHGDHRIAMSAAVMGLVADDEVLIDQAEMIATSYPGFVDDLNRLGADVSWVE